MENEANGINYSANGGRGLLLVLSGPSGVGKGTVIEQLKELCPQRLGRPVSVSVSKTTRQPRPGETEGVHYYFTDRESFLKGVSGNDFLEHAEYAGNLYGTPRAAIEQKIAAGEIVVLDIDTQGAFQVRRSLPEALLVFLLPPSMEELERRRGEQEALTLALDGLAQANGELQARFSPELNRAAGEILSRLTGGKYGQVSLTRQFEALAAQAGGLTPRRALTLSPRLLLIDEVSMGLMPIMVNTCFKVIHDLNQRGITVLVVEQNANKALKVADRGYVLETGNIVLTDTAENLRGNDVVQKAYLGT